MNLEAEFFTRLINNQSRIFTTPIGAEDFNIPAYRAAFSEAKRQIKNDIIPDMASIAVALPDYSAQLMATNTLDSTNFDYFEQQMIEAVEKRRYMEAGMELLRLGESGSSSDEIRRAAMAAVSRCSIKSEGSAETTIYDVAMEFGPVLEERYALKGKLSGITSGFDRLDKVLGGFKPNIYYIGARPSQGKTAMMLSMMRAAMKSGRKAAVITIESSERAIIERMLSSEGPVLMNRLKTGTVKPEDLNSLDGAITRFKQWGGLISFNPKGEIGEIERTATNFVKGGGAEILFIDYLQRISAPGRSKIEEVANASRMVTDLSRILDIPVICLAQTGRQADNEAPQMSHFQHSSQIEQDADVAMVINHRTDEDKEASFLTVLKNRDGEVGDVPVYFDRSHVRFLTRSEL